MSRRRTPWKILGIARTASERDIKIAYARKLKVTRPEDDAEAFQELVEARDIALAHARHGWHDEENQEDDDAELPSSPEPLPDIPAKSPTFEALETPEPERLSAAGEPEPESSQDDFSGAVERIKGWLSGEKINESFPDVDRALREISPMSLGAREDAEREFLIALHRRVEREEFPSFESETKYLIGLLDDEFGWTSNDRRLVEILGYDATTVADRLQYLRHPPGIFSGQPEKPNYWGFIIWIIFVVIFVVGAVHRAIVPR